MASSVYLAQLMGPVLLAAAVGLLIRPDAYRTMAQEFLRSPTLIYLAGILSMTAGVAIILSHNVWVADWRVLITLFGWLAAIGGAMRITFPHITRTVGLSMLDKPHVLTIGGAAWAALGAILCIFGYFR